MILIATILPIVILISIPVIFFFLRARIKFVTVKITHWLLFIYIGLLLLSMAVAPFVWGDEPNREKFQEVDMKHGIDLFDTLSKGEKIDSKYIIQREKLNYEGPMLTIASNSEDGSTIFIERKASNDSNIEAFVYSNGLIINDYNFTDQLVPIDLSVANDTLTIYYPEQHDINFSLVKREFTINQFKGKSIPNNDHFISHGEQYIYLRIPKNLKLSKEPSNLIYVGE